MLSRPGLGTEVPSERRDFGQRTTTRQAKFDRNGTWITDELTAMVTQLVHIARYFPLWNVDANYVEYYPVSQ